MIVDIVAHIILVLYWICIFLIFCYAMAQLNLLFNYLESKKVQKKREKFDFSLEENIPNVTVQLPIYNEKYVVERLINCICQLEYPKDKLEIQVLDDSTDDSIEETKALVTKFQNQGISIQHIHRTNRIGYKAGALKEGLTIAKGAFVAVFDADFLPQKDWLLQTVPYFKNEKIGVVQTRWGHLNKNYSTLTKIQAFALDAHFSLEQTGRNSKQHFINFNGTAGIWRKTTIIDAGNWQADTLTEDLDLSYRAQLKNWEFIYLEDVITPAELPAIMSAAKSQQFRWNKGGAENFRKMYRKVISSKNIGLKTKLHGVMHLLNSSMFLCIFMMGILSVPMLFIKNTYMHLDIFFDILSLFFVTTLVLFICYWFTYKHSNSGEKVSFFNYFKMFFTFYTIAMGFTFENTLAVLEGFLGKRSEFIRTPKLNIETLKDNWKQNSYINRSFPKKTLVEAGLVLYFIFGMYCGFVVKDFALFPLHLMLVIGYSYVVVQSIKSV
jgi:cellulose synthase/poly-beta-1,6-N-acetylglucosamine synthase-like glycosyltransferase